MPKCSVLAALPAKPEGDGAPEITPAMIEAGMLHIYRFHRDRGVDAEELVENIFRAMWAARPTCRSEQS